MESKEGDISRRDFLKGSATTAAAFALGPEIEMLDKRDDTYTEISHSYLSETHQEATRVSEVLKNEKGASPSNICGPLATGILLGWKLNEDGTFSNELRNESNLTRMEGVIPKEMWLGTPENDISRYLTTFPKEKYDWYHIKESIGLTDFNNIEGAKNLKPGDFLYLDGGSFTHYIAVTRRDSEGRLYSVSNVHGDEIDEFKIEEVMLWDPHTMDGFLRDWAKGVGPERARTGLKGFYLWRRKESAEYICENEAAKELRDTLLNKMREQKRGDWNLYINEIGKGELFEWRNSAIYHNASTIKVPLAILALEAIQSRYKNEVEKEGLEAVLKKRGFEGRTFNQLISAMLVNSEELATENLASYTKGVIGLKEGFSELGMVNTSYEPRRSTQRDLFHCWKSLFTRKYLDMDSTAYLLNKLEEYTENDDTILGEVRKQFPGARQWNKRGTITKELMTVQDGGFLEIPTTSGNRYIYIGIAGTSKPGKEISYEDSRSFISSIMDDITKYIKQSEKSIPPNRFPQ